MLTHVAGGAVEKSKKKKKKKDKKGRGNVVLIDNDAMEAKASKKRKTEVVEDEELVGEGVEADLVEVEPAEEDEELLLQHKLALKRAEQAKHWRTEERSVTLRFLSCKL